eukprot:gnl/TRDRNA2_/TRDRNA2_173689_c0_seq6.p1 gnl/TRDRNA2_/TRDRNA2_173689_c0~~gnl/TRDRNA2_/TRDRNA2_173689_c0_seq6.p1  ORF type:complete len:115 (+),score=29.28 gnl/TRDRNA2_/TRDRNA2_173689_c0_seq6:76-420(+)
MSRLALLLLLVAGVAQSHAAIMLKSRNTLADLYNVAARDRQNPVTVPEQGFDGRMIKHETMMSATADFAAEYGPKEEEPPKPEKKREAPSKSFGARSEASAVIALVAMIAAVRM